MEKDGAVTDSQAMGDDEAEAWTDDMSSWYNDAPAPDVRVKITLVSWSRIEAEREFP